MGDNKCYFGIKGIDPELARRPLDKGGINGLFRGFFPIWKKIPIQWQPGVLKRLLRRDYDSVIMLGSIYYLSYLLAVPFLKIFKVPIIFWTHGFFGER